MRLSIFVPKRILHLAPRADDFQQRMPHQRFQIAIDQLGNIPKHILLDEAAVINGLDEIRIISKIQIAHVGEMHEPIEGFVAKAVFLAKFIT